eukprot:m.259360 g.259360  ORF g.259360 m.259360 type:complete len:58 (+) comp40416_c0_seq13:649-822(+)
MPQISAQEVLFKSQAHTVSFASNRLTSFDWHKEVSVTRINKRTHFQTLSAVDVMAET